MTAKVIKESREAERLLVVKFGVEDGICATDDKVHLLILYLRRYTYVAASVLSADLLP